MKEIERKKIEKDWKLLFSLSSYFFSKVLNVKTINFSSIIHRIIAYRKGIIVLFGLLTLLSLFSILNLKIDSSLQVWFLNDDPNYMKYLDYQKEQGSDEIIIVMLSQDSNIYNKPFLDKLNVLHKIIDSLPFVNASYSISNAEYPVLTTRGLQLKPLYTKNKSPQFAQRKLSQLDGLSKILVSEDGLHAFFYIQMKPVEEINDYRDHLAQAVEEKVTPLFESYHITGSPVLSHGTNLSVAEESSRFSIVTIVVILVFLFFLLPHKKYIVLSIVAIALPTIFLFGIMTAMGIRLNMISMIIPTILMIYSLSDVLHIIFYYQNQKNITPKANKKELIVAALQKSLKPCVFTTITTMTGYLALYVSPLPALKITGLGAFSGLLIAFVLVYVICAIGFYYIPMPKEKVQQQNKKMLAFLHKINYITTQYKEVILGIGLVFTFWGAYSLTQIKVNTNLLNFIKEGKIKEDYRAIDEQLNGTLRYDIRLQAAEGEKMTNATKLKAVAAFQDTLLKRQILNNPFSIVDMATYLKNNSAATLLMKPNLLATLRNTKDKNQTFFHLVSEDLSEISIIGNTGVYGTAAIAKQTEDIQTAFAETIPDSLQIHFEIKGYSPLYLKMNKYILRSQFLSFGTAFVLSFFVLIFFVKKIRTSVLALLPNLLPLLLMIIVMVIFNIPIEASTAMIAPIMIGVAMDDTIHMIHKYKIFKKEGKSVTESMDAAMLEVGQAVVSTTLTLVAGFSVIGLSGLMSIKIFGLLCAWTIFIAFFADVLLLAALLKKFDTEDG